MQKFYMIYRILQIMILMSCYASAYDNPPPKYDSRCQQALTNTSTIPIHVRVSAGGEGFVQSNGERVYYQFQRNELPLSESMWTEVVFPKFIGYYQTPDLNTTLNVGETLYARSYQVENGQGTAILMTYGLCDILPGPAPIQDNQVHTCNPATSKWFTHGTQGRSGNFACSRVNPISGGPEQRSRYVVETGPNTPPPLGLYLDRASQTPVYVGYDEPIDVKNKNISFIPNVLLPLPKDRAYPRWANIVPIKCYNMTYAGKISGSINRWCSGPSDNPITAFSYRLSYNENMYKILTQSELALEDKEKKGDTSVAWWKNAKELSEIIYLTMPKDITRIQGLYHDQASGKNVYVGYDETKDVPNNNITFMPDVPLPLPKPPVYPRWGDIAPIKCYNLTPGYILTGGLNRWCDGSNKLFLKKFRYYVTEDLNGNILLIQGDCDFTGVPDSSSLTWWKNAKVLIKKTKSKANTSTIKNPSHII